MTGSSSQKRVADRNTLVKLLGQSQLLSEPQLAELNGEELRPCGGVALLQSLIERNWITAWQSEGLLKGRSKFFIGDYLLLDLVARGGMGTVYKARHPVTGEPVALKTLARQFRQNARSIIRFKREIRAVSVLDHPNIVRALDAGDAEGMLFLVMEYFPGRSLRWWIDSSERLPVGWVCECVRQTALGLQHAHEHDLIHRDVNTANVLVCAESPYHAPDVRVLDFGLARICHDDESGLTRDDQIMGTVDYMAPEQARHVRRVDIRADIYSLGCLAFEMLTGRLPLQGTTVIEKLMVRASDDAPPVTDLRPDTPLEVAAIVGKMLARKVEDRYQVPAEVASALAPHASILADSGVDFPALEQQTATPQEQSPFDSFLSEIATTAPQQISRTRQQSKRKGYLTADAEAGKERPLRTRRRVERRRSGHFLDRNLYALLGIATAVAAATLYYILHG